MVSRGNLKFTGTATNPAWLFRSAADSPGVATGAALGAVSSLGYLGFLAGPPMIGGLAGLAGLQLAAGLLAVAAALVVVLASAAAVPVPVASRSSRYARRARTAAACPP